MGIVPISKSHSRYRHTLWNFTDYNMFAPTRRQAISAAAPSVARSPQDLGTKLFDRLRRRVRLTEAGRVFIPHPRAILEQMDVARLSVAEPLPWVSFPRSDAEPYDRSGPTHRRRNDIGLGARPAGPIHRCRDSYSPTPICVLIRRVERLRVQERSVSAASPEVGEDDHTCDRRVRAPQRGERVPFKRQNN